jgi:flagellar biosynthesis GTPase FlhF
LLKHLNYNKKGRRFGVMLWRLVAVAAMALAAVQPQENLESAKDGKNQPSLCPQDSQESGSLPEEKKRAEKQESAFPPRIERKLSQEEKARRYQAEMARIRAVHAQKAERAAQQRETQRRRNLIAHGVLEQGFTLDEVAAAWGKPRTRNRHNYPELGVVYEFWHYKKSMVVFHNGVCVGWSFYGD